MKKDAPEQPHIIDEIYTDEEGDKDESLKKINQSSRRRTGRSLLIALGVLLLLVVSAVAGFLTFNRKQQFDEKGVTLSVATPSSATSAAATTLIFTVTNNETVGITDIELTMSVPDGWTFKSSQPQPADANDSLWRLGSLASKRATSLELTGTLVGQVGSVKTFSASATYRPANFNYDFTARASGSLTIGSSTLELDLQGPTQISPNAKGIYTLTYANTSDDAIRGLRLTATYPAGFQFSSAKPKPSEGNTVWVVDELKDGGTGTIKVEGSFTGQVSDSVQLTFVADLHRGAQVERQTEVSAVILLSDIRLQLDFSVNGQSTKSVASPGQTLSYELNYKNDGDNEFGSAIVNVALSGGGLDQTTFSDDFGAKFKDGQATWDAKLVPALASIKPGSSGTLRWSVKVLETPLSTSEAGGPTVVSLAEVKLGTIGPTNAPTKTQTVKSESLVTKILSRTTLSVDARYYTDDGEQVGAGPLPPKVGKATSYRVYWYLANTTNELDKVTVKATVPAAVFWTGKNVSTSAGTVNFDPASRIVTWTLNRLPVGVGQQTPNIFTQFELSLTPAAADAGLIPTLLQESQLSGTDSFTGTTIDVKPDAVTTDLPNDPKASGQGVVES